MSEHKNKYGNDSIRDLGKVEAIRLRPASIGITNHEHLFVEILANSIDEYRENFGDTIEIVKYEDKSISVKDRGRGVPMGKRSDGSYSWEAVFDRLWSGGKYSNSENSEYMFSLGTNGCGSTAVNYCSSYMYVESIRDNKKYTIKFKEGLVDEPYQEIDYPSEQTSTFIHFLPDKKVFGEYEISNQFIEDVLKRQSIINKNLKFIFTDKNTDTTKEFYYQDGVIDYVKEVSQDKHFTDIVQWNVEDNITEEHQSFKFKIELTFTFNNEHNTLDFYHNSSYLENGGLPDKAIRAGFTYVIDKLLKQSGKYNKGEKITFDDIKDSLIVVSNSYSTNSLFTDQTKKSIGNKPMQDYMTEWVKNQLEIYLIENKIDCEKILSQTIVNLRSRVSAEKTRLNIKKKLQESITVTNRVEGFINCQTKDRNKAELFIVEGKSALGSVKQGRDADFQAIIAVRGKILNCLKADYEKIFKNEIILDLLKVIGCGVEVKSKYNKELNTFDIGNLRWNKIILLSDADKDGYHVRTLLLTMLYCLTPTLIQRGFVYIAESPLFEVLYKDKSYFAFDEKEKNELVKQFNGKCIVQRSKGLGENEPEMMWQSTLNPETRKLIQITMEDVEHAIKTFDMLLGDNLTDRKLFIEQNLPQYIEFVE